MEQQNYGIIRDRTKDILQVMNNNTGEIATCYHDSYSDTYCVAGHMSSWCQRGELQPTWQIVDGSTTLYLGHTPVNVIVDKDPID